MINRESICEKCLKKDGCQTYKELKEVTEIYLVDTCEKYIKDVNTVLDKIRDEIIDLYNDRQNTQDSERTKFFRKVLDIIDKYK